MNTIATELHELEVLRVTMDVIFALTDDPPETIPRDSIVTQVRDTVQRTRELLQASTEWATRSES